MTIRLTDDIDQLTTGYLAALKLNSDEIARLAGALRQVVAERDGWKRIAGSNLQGLERVAFERDAARAELSANRVERINAQNSYTNALSALDAARADAERLAQAMNIIAYEPIGDAYDSYYTVYSAIVEIARATLAVNLAAHAQAVAK